MNANYYVVIVNTRTAQTRDPLPASFTRLEDAEQLAERTAREIAEYTTVPQNRAG